MEGIRRWILRRLFGTTSAEAREPRIGGPVRKIDVGDVEEFFIHIAAALSPTSVLETHAGGSLADDVADEYRAMQVDPEIALDGAWFSSDWSVFRIPASHVAGQRLARLASNHAEPELAIHIYATGPAGVLRDWSDFPDDPAWFSGHCDTKLLERLAEACGGQLTP